MLGVYWSAVSMLGSLLECCVHAREFIECCVHARELIGVLCPCYAMVLEDNAVSMLRGWECCGGCMDGTRVYFYRVCMVRGVLPCCVDGMASSTTNGVVYLDKAFLYLLHLGYFRNFSVTIILSQHTLARDMPT